MTTNGAGNLDKGIRSRATGVIDFPKLDEAAREKCWKNFLDTGVLPTTEDTKEDIENLLPELAANFPLNGRDIRDAIHVARSTAAEEQDDEMKIFPRYLTSAAKGQLERRKALEETDSKNESGSAHYYRDETVEYYD